VTIAFLFFPAVHDEIQQQLPVHFECIMEVNADMPRVERPSL
jgi:hypothetical protein